LPLVTRSCSRGQGTPRWWDSRLREQRKRPVLEMPHDPNRPEVITSSVRRRGVQDDADSRLSRPGRATHQGLVVHCDLLPHVIAGLQRARGVAWEALPRPAASAPPPWREAETAVHWPAAWGEPAAAELTGRPPAAPVSAPAAARPRRGGPHARGTAATSARGRRRRGPGGTGAPARTAWDHTRGRPAQGAVPPPGGGEAAVVRWQVPSDTAGRRRGAWGILGRFSGGRCRGAAGQVEHALVRLVGLVQPGSQVGDRLTIGLLPCLGEPRVLPCPVLHPAELCTQDVDEGVRRRLYKPRQNSLYEIGRSVITACVGTPVVCF
jgi:hypothetical protein